MAENRRGRLRQDQPAALGNRDDRASSQQAAFRGCLGGAIGGIPPVRQLPAERTEGEADRVGSWPATHSRRMARTAGPRTGLAAEEICPAPEARRPGGCAIPRRPPPDIAGTRDRSEAHTSELTTQMRISY